MEKKQEKKTLVIRIDGGLGRVIAMTGAITEKAKRQPVKVITSRPLVFWGNPFIKSVHGLDDRRLFEDVIKGNDYIELEPYTDPKFFNEAVNWLEIVREKLGLEKVYEPILFLAEHEKQSIRLNGDKPIVFQPFGSTMEGNGADRSYRSIRVKDAQYLADGLTKKGYTVYVVAREDQPNLNNTYKLSVKDLSEMRNLIALVAKYPLLGCDSSLHHAAKAFNTKATVLRAGTDVERYGYASHNNMREYPMAAHTPLRLSMNDFNYDISNQHTNEFTKEFLDKVLANY